MNYFYIQNKVFHHLGLDTTIWLYQNEAEILSLASFLPSSISKKEKFTLCSPLVPFGIESSLYDWIEELIPYPLITIEAKVLEKFFPERPWSFIHFLSKLEEFLESILGDLEEFRWFISNQFLENEENFEEKILDYILQQKLKGNLS